MKGRMFSSEIRNSRNFAKLTLRQRDLFHGLIEAVADDQGRMLADAALIKAKVWIWDDFSTAKTQADLEAMASGQYPFILFYEIDENRYIQILKWWKWQHPPFAAPSLYPAPEGWVDRVKIQTKGNKALILNWDQPGGFAENQAAAQEVSTEVSTPPCTQVNTEVVREGKEKVKKGKEKEEKEKLTHSDIRTCLESAFWDEAIGQLRAEMKTADFDTWIKPLIFSRVDEFGRYVILAHNSYGAEWVKSRASPTLERILCGLAGRKVEIVITSMVSQVMPERAVMFK